MAIDISKTLIANMALSHVGTAPIESFEEKTAEADQIVIWYEWSRAMALEAFDWNFARRRKTAALHSDTISTTSTDPMAGVWGFRYQMPSDAIVIRKIQNPNSPPDDASPFEIEENLDGKEKTILTDVEDAVIVYTRDVTEVGLFSAHFIITLSHLIAHFIAFSLTGKIKIQQTQLENYETALNMAGARDANEQVSKKPREAEWIRGR